MAENRNPSLTNSQLQSVLRRSEGSPQICPALLRTSSWETRNRGGNLSGETLMDDDGGAGEASAAAQTCLTGKNAFCPNFHTEWSNSCLQDLANQTLLPLALPNCTANNFHCDWARWAKQATQATQLFTSSCPSWLRRTGTAFFPVSQVWTDIDHIRKQTLIDLPDSYLFWKIFLPG